MMSPHTAFLTRWNRPVVSLVLLLAMLPLCARPLLGQGTAPARGAVRPADEAPPSPLPDARYKADILVIVAHPDDETAITGYLIKAISDEHKRVAVVFGTGGNSGGNAVGYEQGATLAAVREIEARRALASIGVFNVWFLSGTDTPGDNVLRSLETWGHGTVLDQAVRIVRLTRPEVILTWLPHFVVGENHGDHQASAVIATEAFDLAGDVNAFPEQVAFPRDRTGYSNLTEGLRPWQPEKLYFFSDASQMAFMNGQGPVYSVMDVSPSLHMPYYRAVAMEESYHLTQDDTGQQATAALETGNFKDFELPIRFVFGKSLVGGSVTGDIFQGVVPGPIPFVRDCSSPPPVRNGLSMDLGGEWAFYGSFWPGHGIGHLADLMKEPEIGVAPGGTLELPLLLHNNTDLARTIHLRVDLPSGWTEQPGPTLYPVRPHDVTPVRVVLTAPMENGGQWQPITWRAESGGKLVGSVRVKTILTHASNEQIH
ncbi:MAG: PIG-L family deacetylase [Acidobacteriaceae bacterium]